MTTNFATYELQIWEINFWMVPTHHHKEIEKKKKNLFCEIVKEMFFCNLLLVNGNFVLVVVLCYYLKGKS